MSKVAALALQSSAPAKTTGLDVETAFRRNYQFVWRTVACMGVPAAHVDDVVQEVFMTAHRRRADYDPSSSERRWLFGIARFTARNHRRKLGRQRKRASCQDPAWPPPLEPESEVRLTRRRAVELVELFLDRLPERQREVFVLADIQGFSAPEISRLLRVKLNTVYSRLRLARQRFERVIARRHAEPEGVSHG